MATFNGAKYLSEQLADLAGQSVLPSELVVCDDGSSDDTLAILEGFGASAPFKVHLHRNTDRLGYRANFLKCASLCRSDLIAFCDQDDRWLPAKIATMLACFDDPEVLLAFHGAQVVAHDERPLGFTKPSRRGGATPPLEGSPWTFALGFTQVFRRWLCDCDRWWPLSHDHNSPREPLAHDQWYFFLASSLGTIVNVDAPLARYRQHDANVFGRPAAGRSFAARIRNRVRLADSSTQRRVRAATQRALILDLAAEALPPPYGERAHDAGIAYRRLAAQSAHRAAIYAGSRFRDRARSFAALVTAHGYGRHPWRYGTQALAMDLAVGLPGLPRGQSNDDADAAGEGRHHDAVSSA
jgi:glycosyltransferase involved in cell wall biosynthesis